MNLGNPRHRFELDDHAALHDEVQLVAWESPALIRNQDCLLALEFQPGIIKLEAIGSFVDRFLVTGSEDPTDSDPAPDYAVSHLLDVLRNWRRSDETH